MSRLALACLLSSALVLPAAAEMPKATYDIYVAGLNVGSATVTPEANGKSYDLKLSGRYGFLLNRGSFNMASKGALDGEKPRPQSYRMSSKGDEESSTRVSFTDGKASAIDIKPEPTAKEKKGRVPLKDEHLSGAVDPLSALLLLALRAGASAEDGCKGSVPVFTGQVRASLQLSAERETASEVICKVKFKPVAGHRKTANLKRIEASDDIRVGFPKGEAVEARWPSSASVPLRFGTLTLALRK
jgi:Protein of unknown function (DUF3108)